MLAIATGWVETIVNYLPVWLQQLIGITILSVFTQALSEKIAEQTKFKDSTTVQSLAIMASIYLGCLASLRVEKPWPMNLLVLEVLLFLFALSVFTLLSITEEYDNTTEPTDFIGFVKARVGRAARSGLVAMHVLVLRSALPPEGTGVS